MSNQDLFPGRSSSRRTRIDTLEDLMMMEAIRQSIAAEEERKKKEDKDAAKQAKKDEKQAKKDAKEAKKNGKAANRTPSFPFGDITPSSSGIGESSSGKGKASERTPSDSPSTQYTAQDMLGSILDPSSGPGPVLTSPSGTSSPNSDGLLLHHGQALRHHSSASSFSDLPSGGANGSRLSIDANHTQSGDSGLNFRSLAEVVDGDHVEHQSIQNSQSSGMDQSTSSTFTTQSGAPTVVATPSPNDDSGHKIPRSDITPGKISNTTAGANSTHGVI